VQPPAFATSSLLPLASQYGKAEKVEVAVAVTVVVTVVVTVEVVVAVSVWLDVQWSS
jgi:hypothetical protein